MSRRLTKELREFEKILNRNGYEYVRAKGSHYIYTNRLTHKTIPVNIFLNRMVRERLIREYNLQEGEENDRKQSVIADQ